MWFPIVEVIEEQCSRSHYCFAYFTKIPHERGEYKKRWKNIAKRWGQVKKFRTAFSMQSYSFSYCLLLFYETSRGPHNVPVGFITAIQVLILSSGEIRTGRGN